MQPSPFLTVIALAASIASALFLPSMVPDIPTAVSSYPSRSTANYDHHNSPGEDVPAPVPAVTREVKRSTSDTLPKTEPIPSVCPHTKRLRHRAYSRPGTETQEPCDVSDCDGPLEDHMNTNTTRSVRARGIDN